MLDLIHWCIVTRPEQKERERRAVERFRELYAGFPPAEPEDCPEPLDFIVRQPPRPCIGIEVTDFVIGDRAEGSQLNAYQRLASTIAEAAQDAHRALNAPPVIAAIKFQRSLVCRSRDMRRFAEVIAAQVADLARTSGAGELHASDSRLPEGVDYVTVRTGASENSHFLVTEAQWYGTLLPADIDDVIASKEGKLQVYRLKCPQAWLLIVVDAFKLSGMVEPAPELATASYPTGFDAVFLLYDFARVITLKAPTA